MEISLRIRKGLFFFFVVFWILFIGQAYFINFPIPNLKVRFLELFFVFLIILIGFALGKRLFKFFGVSFVGFGEEAIFSLGLGWGILSYLVFGLGVYKLLYRNLFYFIFIILGILLIPEIKYFLLSIINLTKRLEKSSFSIWDFILIGILTISIFLPFIATFVPPTFYDSLVYHLACPGTYIQQHKLLYFPYNLFSNFPQNVEMLFTLGILLYDDIISNLLHFSFSIMLIVSIYSFCIRHLKNRKIALLSMLIFSATPTVMLLSCGTYIDLGLTFFVFLSVYALVIWWQDNKYTWFIVSSIFCGLALATKYTGTINLFILMVVVLWKLIIKDKGNNMFKNILKYPLVYIFLSLLILLPWLVKNFVYTGNPVFPFLYRIFNGKNFSLELARNYIAPIRKCGVSICSFFDLCFLPWRITMEGIKFGGGFDMWGDVWGPLFLFFLPLLFFIRKITNVIKQIALYSLLYFLIWVMTGKVLRFLVVIIPFLSILTAYCLIRIEEKGKWWKITRFIVVISIISNFFLFGYTESLVEPFPVALGIESRKEYLLRKLPYYKGMEFINNNLPKDAKILFIGETRSYYCNHQYIASTVFDLNPVVEIANSSRDEEEMLEKLKGLGITHIFYNAKEAERLEKGYHIFYWTNKGYRVNEKFKKKYLKCIYKQKSMYVYVIKYKLHKES